MSSNEVPEVDQQADDIAKKLIDMLVEAFRTRESREPTGEEVEEMLSELTTERVAALMSGEDDAAITTKEAEEVEDEKVVVDKKKEAPVAEEDDKENSRKNDRSTEEEEDSEEDAVVKPVVNPFGFTPASIAVQPAVDSASKRQKLSE